MVSFPTQFDDKPNRQTMKKFETETSEAKYT